MTHLFRLAGWKTLLLLPLLALALCGCGTNNSKDVMAAPSENENDPDWAARLHTGDSITISLSGVDGLPQPVTKIINDDGTISLDTIGSFKAAGKTPGEVQQEIHDAFVPKYYTHLDVTVTPGDRVFYVSGEVKEPGRQIYVGQITVTKAITSSGDFTDYANRRNVVLTRANGKRFKLNCDAILNGDVPDPPVFPGDSILVKRRLY